MAPAAGTYMVSVPISRECHKRKIAEERIRMILQDCLEVDRCQLPSLFYDSSSVRRAYKECNATNTSVRNWLKSGWHGFRNSSLAEYTKVQKTSSQHHIPVPANAGGISSHVRPFRSRPAFFLFTPPHCLKKNETSWL